MMAASGVLQRLQSRAAQAEQMIAQLRSQLDVIRTTAVASACRKEEERLRNENDQLRMEVDQVKNQLILAETRNGVKQVTLPNAARTSSPSAAVLSPIEKPSTAAAPGDMQNRKQPKQEKKKKGGDNKPKTQPAVPEAPVDVGRLNMRVGHIVNVKRHPDADTLYIEEVNLGEDRNRTIISGLVKHVPVEQMSNRLAIFLINLKPAKMRGILSEGMIMCASTPEKVEIIDPPGGAMIGDKITVEGYPGEADAQLNPKKKIWEAVQPDLTINSEGLATYKGTPWIIVDKGVCKAPSLKNVGIK